MATEVLAVGATREELAKAWAWVNSDEAMMGEGRHLPGGQGGNSRGFADAGPDRR